MNDTFFNSTMGHKRALAYRISRRNSGDSKLFLRDYKYSPDHIRYYRLHNSEDLGDEDRELWWTYMSPPPLMRATDDYHERLYVQNVRHMHIEFKRNVANSIRAEKKAMFNHCGAHTLCPLRRFNGDVGVKILSFL